MVPRRALRSARSVYLTSVRSYAATTPPPPPPTPTPTPTPSSSKSKKPVLSSEPLPSPAPQFPPPNNPFEPAAQPAKKAEYSESTKTLVRGVAKLMGYNSKASTAIRETGRMVRSIVEAIEDDKVFWYQECKLPATYQTFFQLHLLYVLVLMPRLRALPASEVLPPHSIPEPISTTPPQGIETPSSSASILTKPTYEAYPTETLNHFFEMAESQMRVVLGKGERERVVRKYMDEMGEQWKGAGVGLDYVLGLTISEKHEERIKADEELASWVWRNLFQGKGLGKDGGAEEVDMADQLEKVVRFIRKEMARLDQLEDADVVAGNIGRWSMVKEA